MPKYAKGDVVWGGRLEHGDDFVIESAVVKSCGEAQVTLEGYGGRAFDYRKVVPVDSVYPSEFDALIALGERANNAIEKAEDQLKAERRRKSSILDAMTKLAKDASGIA